MRVKDPEVIKGFSDGLKELREVFSKYIVGEFDFKLEGFERHLIENYVNSEHLEYVTGGLVRKI